MRTGSGGLRKKFFPPLAPRLPERYVLRKVPSMKTYFPCLVILCIVASPLAALSQQDLPDLNADALLKEIETMEQKQKATKTQERAAILAAVSGAATTGPVAANFYEKAVEEVQFKGKKDKAAAFVDWKKANADFLRTREMQASLLLHLKYLEMALQRKNMENPEKMVPGIMAYVNEVIAADSVFSGQDKAPKEQSNLLDQPLGQSVFAQWLQLGQWLPEDKIWEQKPGDVGGILEKNVRSILREKKDPMLLQTWDVQLKVEADRITEGRLQHEIDKFNNVTRPKLLFKRAQDMVIVGQPNRAAGEMVALLRANPTHPDFSSWLSTVRGLLATKPAEQTSPQ